MWEIHTARSLSTTTGLRRSTGSNSLKDFTGNTSLKGMKIIVWDANGHTSFTANRARAVVEKWAAIQVITDVNTLARELADAMSGKVIALVNPGMVTQSVADRLLKAIASKNIPLFVDSDEAKHGIRALNRKESIVQKLAALRVK